MVWPSPVPQQLYVLLRIMKCNNLMFGLKMPRSSYHDRKRKKKVYFQHDWWIQRGLTRFPFSTKTPKL